MRLENKVALITGGASGMGESMARLFAREGAKVAIADMLDEEGRRVASEITQANGAAIFHKLDVTSEAEWQQAIDATVAAFGRLDILVNDAGISGSAVEDLFDTAAWERLMAVNATGTFLGMKLAIPLMKQAGGGAIVNISSISGVTCQRGPGSRAVVRRDRCGKGRGLEPDRLGSPRSEPIRLHIFESRARSAGRM